jgi:hypothetical protein
MKFGTRRVTNRIKAQLVARRGQRKKRHRKLRRGSDVITPTNWN